MSNARVPSPARSQGVPTPLRMRNRSRKTRSVGSPARSNASTRQSAITQKENMNSFVLSPLERRSVLNDDTDIDLVPGRDHWWKRLDENSRTMEVLRDENNKSVNFNNGVEDIEVDVLSQEKNYTIDLSESENETVVSIVLPQRKGYLQKVVHKHNKYGQIIENRETLHKINKTNSPEKSLKVTKKNLFNHNKQTTRPAFTAALLQISPNKTAANKTNEMPVLEVKNQARNLFHNRAEKQKNMFADFIASESEDEIPEIQSNVFEFNKKPKAVRLTGSTNSRGVRDSPTNMSLMPDMDDWKMLPSSTMVEHQLEGTLTPMKRERLSKQGPHQSDVHISEMPGADEKEEEERSGDRSHEKDNFKVVIEKAPTTEQNAENNEQDKDENFVMENEEHNEDGKHHVYGEDNQDDNDENVVEVMEEIEQNAESDAENENQNNESGAENGEEIENHKQVSDNDDYDELAAQSEEENEEEIENDKQVSDNEDFEEPTAQSEVESDNQDEDIEAEEQQNNAESEVEDEGQDMENENHEIQDEYIEAEVAENVEQTSENPTDEEQSDVVMNGEIEDSNEQRENVEETLENPTDDELSDVEMHGEIEDSNEQEDEVEQNESEEDSNVENDNLENSLQESDDEQNAEDVEQDENEEICASQEIEHEATEIKKSVKEHDSLFTAKTDKTNDTTDSNRNRNDKVTSPEAILHNATNEMDSFSARARNTSIRKTKSMMVHSIQTSLAIHRDSTGLSDGTKNSSAEGSGWDSHRVTRKTIRQTLGKEFTPRKSLRALVMEKSAKRQTAISDMHMETIKYPQANSTEFPDDSGRLYENPQESVHEVSLRTRQATLQMNLQKIKKQNMEKRMKIDEAVRNSIKAPPNHHDFKVPAIPRRHHSKPGQNAKPKALKAVVDLPLHIQEDLKYKPPKRFRPSNAGWMTKRLYKFLEAKLEPKYDYRARVRAEKLVIMIYEFTKQLRKNWMTQEATQQLKHEMARLQIVRTHYEFYQFFREFMPREVRIKVNPDVVNGLPVPRDVFSDILR